MLNTAQWPKVPFGASGSSTVGTRFFVQGIPDHFSGDETFSPSREYLFGIPPNDREGGAEEDEWHLSILLRKAFR